MDKKEFVSKILVSTKITDAMFQYISKKTGNNYIRVINYHEVYPHERENFCQQFKYFKEQFVNCDYNCFVDFLKGKFVFKNKPGIMISFDDGYKGNYDIAAPILEEFGFTGWFMVSSGNIGNEYMTENNISELKKRGHVIGCHSFSHHRMNVSDSDDILYKEIIYAKERLEDIVNDEINIWCWCGGEKGTYTSNAYKYIKKAGYKYGFMTDSYPVFPACNAMHIQRTNIQTYWSLDVVKFQISGFMDLKYNRKRKIEERIVSG